jgi:macrolide-specific efflux system membrane fusion protein
MIAPYDGVVMRMGLVPGAHADAFAVWAVVGDPTHLAAQVGYLYELANSVDANTVVYLRPTKEAEPKYQVKFVPNFLPISDKKGGISISAGSDVSINYFYFSIPDTTPREQIQVGSKVKLQVILGSKQDALLLPPPAIRGNDTFSYVIVLDGDYHRRVEVVQIGIKTTEKWEVIANLKEGDQVLGP